MEYVTNTSFSNKSYVFRHLWKCNNVHLANFMRRFVSIEHKIYKSVRKLWINCRRWAILTQIRVIIIYKYVNQFTICIIWNKTCLYFICFMTTGVLIKYFILRCNNIVMIKPTYMYETNVKIARHDLIK